ncbi:extracellular solute-binding protein [Lachnospiraceae bacterium 54-53]
MRLKNVLGAVLAAALVAGLAGCGQSAGEKDRTVETSGGTGKEKMQVSIWHVWPEGNGGTALSFQKTLKEMEEKFPDVEFVIDAVADSGDAYKTKIKTAVAGGEAPDIFYSWGGGFSQNFVDAGKVLCLDDYMDEETKGKIIEGTTNNFFYNGKLYGLPTRVNVGLLYCNKKMFEEAGLELPKTYDELTQVVKAFKAKGITPMCVGAKDTWTAAMYLNALTMREAGTDYVNQVVNGKATIDTPEIKESVRLFQDMIDAGAFADGAVAISKDESQAVFLSGGMPMYYNGSWLCANIYDSDIKDDIVAINFPTVAGGKGDPNEFLGGADQTFMINSETKNPEKVVEIYKFMCESFSKNVFVSGAGLPTWKSDVDTSTIENQLLAEAYNLYQNSTGLSLWWDTALTSEKATNHLETVTETFMKTITPDEFIEKHKAFLQ